MSDVSILSAPESPIPDEAVVSTPLPESLDVPESQVSESKESQESQVSESKESQESQVPESQEEEAIPSTPPPERHYLSKRGNWELAANTTGASLRDAVKDALEKLLNEEFPKEYSVEAEPKRFKQFYLEEDYKAHPECYIKPETPEKGDIWYDETEKKFMEMKGTKANGTPTIGSPQCGLIPDIGIIHIPSGKAYYIECKSQNDAGNAHERCAKYASPSVIEGMQKKLGVSYHPIGYIFSGTLVEKRKYILELQTTYRFSESHLLLWKPTRPIDVLGKWIKTIVRIMHA